MPRKPTGQSVAARFIHDAQSLSDTELRAAAVAILSSAERVRMAFQTPEFFTYLHNVALKEENEVLRQRLRRRKKDGLLKARNDGIIRDLKKPNSTLRQVAKNNPTPVLRSDGTIVYEETSIEAVKKVQYNRRQEVIKKQTEEEAHQGQ